MAKPDKISRFLPISFSNGNSICHFGEHCPRCRTLVEAEYMEGVASKQQDKIFLAAYAHCQKCNLNFPVGYIITNDKRVHRIVFPQWLFRLWLRFITRHDIQPVSQENWEISKPNQMYDEPVLSKGIGISTKRSEVNCSEEIVGWFQGHAIPTWIEYQGRRFTFERAAPQANRNLVGSDELLLENELIYRISQEL